MYVCGICYLNVIDKQNLKLKVGFHDDDEKEERILRELSNMNLSFFLFGVCDTKFAINIKLGIHLNEHLMKKCGCFYPI